MSTPTIAPSRVLADIIHHMKYARFVPDKKRRETFRETVQRNEMMHIKKFPHLEEEIKEAYHLVYTKKILPSMRSMQFGGNAVEKNNLRIYNCSACHIDNPEIFKEIIFLLLSGCGVGYSVQTHHIAQLPPFTTPNNIKTFEVEDSIEGWADSIGAIFDAFFYGKHFPLFIYDKIRSKGTPLVTSGGVAPGPNPLKEAHRNLLHLLSQKKPGSKLLPIEAHDLLCFMATAVLSGGIRRSSYIALFSKDDQKMMNCKSGNWWEKNPQRALANNSPVVLRNELTPDLFESMWKKLVDSGSGEPNIFQTNSLEAITNPCAEIGLQNRGLCNLVEINAATIQDQVDFEHRARMASRIATMQASYTDFNLIRKEWKEQAEKEALIGVGMTGIAAGKVMSLDLREAALTVVAENKRVAKLIGINPAKRTTTIKPSGTTSLELGNGAPISSGVHSYHAEHYLRRVIITHTEPIYQYLQENHPWSIEPSAYRPDRESVLTIPLKAPKNAITRWEGPIALLERIKKLHQDWIVPGHISGDNTNNVSCTISVKEDEWDKVKKWWWENKDHFVSITLLPFDGGNYKQLPFEECTSEDYEQKVQQMKDINLKMVLEEKDTTSRQQEAACSSGYCEII